MAFLRYGVILIMLIIGLQLNACSSVSAPGLNEAIQEIEEIMVERELVPLAEDGFVASWLEPNTYLFFQLGDDSYRFMTPDGQIINNSILSQTSSISTTSFIENIYDEIKNWTAPVLLLWTDTGAWDGFRVAALDGSWITMESYASHHASKSSVFLVNRQEEFVFIDWDGNVSCAGKEGLIKSAGHTSFFYLHDGSPRVSDNHFLVVEDQEPYDYYLLYFKTGELFRLDWINELGYFVDGVAPASSKGAVDSVCSYGYIDDELNWIIAPQYRHAEPFWRGEALVTTQNGTSAIINLQNEVVYEFENGFVQACYWDSGSFYWAEKWTEALGTRCVEFYSRELDMSAFNPLNQEISTQFTRYAVSHCYSYDEELGGSTVFTVDQPFFISGTSYVWDRSGDYFLASVMTEQGELRQYIRGATGQAFVPPQDYRSYDIGFVDYETGAYYFRCEIDEGTADYVDEQSRILFSLANPEYAQLQHGVFVITRQDGVEILNSEGDLLFKIKK